MSKRKSRTHPLREGDTNSNQKCGPLQVNLQATTQGSQNKINMRIRHESVDIIKREGR